MSNAFWVYGSKLQLGDGQSPTETFVDVAEVRDITPPSLSRDVIDVTNQQSTEGWREKIPGFRDGGEVTFECNWLPKDATQDGTTGLLSTFNDELSHNWKIVLPDTISVVSFSGFVTGYEPDMPLEEQGQLSVTITVTGKVVIN
jgi:predicted secreted protein